MIFQYGKREYEVPWLADFFHQFPHVNLSFKVVNSTFNPEDAGYLESLGIIAVWPILFLILTWIIFLCYFCYVCCQGSNPNNNKKAKQATCLKWSIVLLALLTCGAIGLGFFGNEDTHRGVTKSVDAMDEIGVSMHSVQAQVKLTRKIVNTTVEQGIKGIMAEIKKASIGNVTTRNKLLQLAQEGQQDVQFIITQINKVINKTESVDIHRLVAFSAEIEFYRWIATIMVNVWYLFLCLLLLGGAARASKCVLLVFAMLCCVSLLVVYAVAGVFLGASVGLGDLCMDPHAFVLKQGKQVMDENILKYYVECKDTSRNPFRQNLDDASQLVKKSNESITDAYKMALPYISKIKLDELVGKVRTGLSKCSQSLTQLSALVNCNSVHQDYNNILEGVCQTAFPGVAFMLVSTLAIGILFSLLIFLASRTWRYFSPRRGYYEIDEDDPFLPRADPASPTYFRYGSLTSVNVRPAAQAQAVATQPQVPAPINNTEEANYAARYAQNNNSPAREQVALQSRNSPPPANGFPNGFTINAPKYGEYYEDFNDRRRPDDMLPDTPSRRPTAPTQRSLSRD